MATGFTDIIAQAMLLIDDIRWRDDLAVNPAAFYHQKSEWVVLALASLNRPPELGEYLTRTMAEPSFAEENWTSDTASMSNPTTVHTGKTGFELCSVALRDASNTKLYAYTDFTYDAETGDVVFGVQSAAGLQYVIDFYTDGTFGTESKPLTVRQKELFALAVAIVWDQRMDRNWLNIQAKDHDSSFNPPSEGTYTREVNQRLMRNIQMFNDKCSKYEQDCAYRHRFFGGVPRTTTLI